MMKLTDEDKDKLEEILGFTNEYRDNLLKIILDNEKKLDEIKEYVRLHEGKDTNYLYGIKELKEILKESNFD